MRRTATTTCFDLGQQIIISAFCVEYLIRVLFGSSCAVPLCLAFVFRSREFFMSLLFLEVSFLETSWRFLEISLTAGLVFSFRLPLATGGWPAVRVSEVLRILEAHGFCSTVSHVVWPVHFIFHAL